MMKNFNHFKSIMILLLFALSINTFAQDYCIKPTTKSKEAKENYYKAMDALSFAEWQSAMDYANKALEKDPNLFMAYFVLTFSNEKDIRDKNTKLMAEYSGKLNKQEMIMKDIAAKLMENPKERPLDLFKKLADSNPKLLFNKTMLGYQFNFSGKKEEAMKVFNEITTSNPEYAPPYNIIGYLHLDNKDFEKAEKVFDKYIELAPERANPYDSKGDYYMAIGNFEKALEHFEKAFAMNSTFDFSEKKAERAKFQIKCEKKKPEVEKVCSELVDAYNSSDLKKFHSYFANDGTFRIVMNGTDNITLKEMVDYQYKHFDELKSVTVTVNKQFINMISPKSAVATQVFDVVSVKKDDTKKNSNGYWSIFLEYQDKNEAWKIIQAIETANNE